MIDRLNAALSERYHLLEQIGEGGMATVFLADDPRHERKVALKVLKPELAAVVGGERFLTEIKTTANLQHPHILPLYDSGEADSFVYYVMPYVKGATLDGRLEAEKQLPVDEAIRIATAVASALDFAHREGVVHRDIKPANILFQDGQPVVSDFGIALAVGAGRGARLTETGLSLGTPYYMSPEQATGDQQVGPRSDIYSLGCVLFEMLTGHPPYHGSTAQAILGQIITADPPLATEHRPSVPPHVEAVLLRSLEKLPADRFETAGAFAAALEDRSLSHRRQTAALGVHSSDGTPSWFSQRASWAALAAVAVLATWAGIAGLTSSPPPLPLPVTQVVLDHEIDVDRVVLSNDGKWLATRPLTEEVIRLRRLEQEGSRELDLGGNADPLGFSPDGRELLASRGDELLRVPVEGGAPFPITRSPVILAADWAEDDRIVFINFEGIFLVSANGGEQEVVREQGVGSAWDIKWLPGGNHVVYASGPIGAPRGEIHVLDLETGESRKVIEDGFSPRYTSSGHLFFLRGDQTLFAVPFHPGRAEDMGQPIPVLDSVVVFSVGPNGLYDVSDVGTLVYSRGPPMGLGSEESRVVFVDRSGSQEMTPVPAGQLQFPRLSPDGQRLAYTRDTRVYVFDLQTGTNPQITPADQIFFSSTWSRDGSRIAAVGLGGGGGWTADVFSAGVPGPGTTVAGVEGRVVLPLGWTPNDDGLLVFIDGLSGGVNSDLGIVRFGSDTTLVPYLQAPWNEGPGALSPDGRWVAYASDESGEDRLYVRSFPEPGPGHDLSPPGIDVTGLPVWARDGSGIFWRFGDSMMASEVTTEADFRAGPARLLFVGSYGPNFDVTEDGRFVMITAPERDSTEAGGDGEPESEHRTILVVNWLEGVKARLKEEGNR